VFRRFISREETPKGGKDGRATLQYVAYKVPQRGGHDLATGDRADRARRGLGGKGKLKVKMVLIGKGTGLNHVVEGEIDLG
jgi:hypothetical protein